MPRTIGLPPLCQEHFLLLSKGLAHWNFFFLKFSWNLFFAQFPSNAAVPHSPFVTFLPFLSLLIMAVLEAYPLKGHPLNFKIEISFLAKLCNAFGWLAPEADTETRKPLWIVSLMVIPGHAGRWLRKRGKKGEWSNQGHCEPGPESCPDGNDQHRAWPQDYSSEVLKCQHLWATGCGLLIRDIPSRHLCPALHRAP